MIGAVTTSGAGRARTSLAGQESAVVDHSQPGSRRNSFFCKFAVPQFDVTETEDTET